VKYHREYPLKNEYTLFEVKARNLKQVLLEVLLGGETVNEEGKGGWIRSIYILYLNRNRTMKLVEIILSKGEGDEGEWCCR
jgi:hypothetical protein